jgi:4-hydroxy-tetrahydrodipicolinate reductase
MTNILLSGACGRMGKEVARLASEYDCHILCGVDSTGQSYGDFPVVASFDEVHCDYDVLIDFSLAKAFEQVIAHVQLSKKPAILCATGYSKEQEELIQKAAEIAPVFRSTNMSKGVYVLNQLAALAKRLLPEADIEIVEGHHRMKADAPSGTAMTLLHTLTDNKTNNVFGRGPQSGKRQKGDIGVHAVRGGSVAGEHEVFFLCDEEYITLKHSAQSRSVFAHGALSAAKFMKEQDPGLYGMQHLFN